MFSEIFLKHKTQMRCGDGCSSCCVQGLSVSAVEALTISQFIEDNSPILPQNPQPGRCEFLDSKGLCTIYEVRPIICRSHGAPIVFKDSDENRNFDVCVLNFVGMDINKLPLADIMNIDTVNMLLTLLNRQFAPDNSEERWPLNPRSLSGLCKKNF